MGGKITTEEIILNRDILVQYSEGINNLRKNKELDLSNRKINFN